MSFLRKALLLVVLIIGLIIALSAGYFYWQRPREAKNQQPVASILPPVQSTAPRPAVQTQTNTEEAVTLTDIPPLYPGLSWQKTTTNALAYPYELRIDAKKRLPLRNGEVWEANRADLDPQEDARLVGGFFGYYESAFPPLGWKFEVLVDGIPIEAPNAAGPGGRYDGFIGIKDGEFRVVVFHEQSNPKGTNAFTCPCDEHLVVFLSDIIPIETIPLLNGQ